MLIYLAITAFGNKIYYIHLFPSDTISCCTHQCAAPFGSTEMRCLWVMSSLKYKRFFSVLQLWSFLESSSHCLFAWLSVKEDKLLSPSFEVLYSFFSSDQERTVEASFQRIPTYHTFIHTIGQCQNTWTRFISSVITAGGALWEHI